MSERYSRRDFLKALAAAAGGAGVILAKYFGGSLVKGLAQNLDYKLYLPFLRNAEGTVPAPTATPTQPPTPEVTPSPISTNPPPPSTRPRVVHVHGANVTSWDGSDPMYWNYVNQAVVDDMVDAGIAQLTGFADVADAWKAILPNYKSGEVIAIKVSFNNSTSCNDIDGQIDAVIEPINSIIRGLLMIGVAETDIWIYDAIRSIPDRFINGCEFPGVGYFDTGCRSKAGWKSDDANAFVTFYPPEGIPTPPEIRISDVLINAHYLINMPIMKRHSFTGVSLAFKNHYGTINYPYLIHTYSSLNGSYYSPDYSVLVDLYLSPHITGKTILTVGDGLFSAFGLGSPPTPWKTFGNQVPKSLFFSTDPVAIDCVMTDFLASEMIIDQRSDDYLKLAGNAGLGVCERGDPWGAGYQQIEYVKVNL